jgi:hypothetical protein
LNKWEKEVAQSLLKSEEEALKTLEKQYKQALKDINEKVKLFDSDIRQLQEAINADGLDETAKAVLQSQQRAKVYQKQYQEALRGQISGVLDNLHGKEYATIEAYLKECYTDGYVGTMYDIAKQGVPIIAPIDQAAVVKAVLTDSKVSKGLYKALGVNVQQLKKKITQEVSRGIATGLSYSEIARNISNAAKAPLNRAMTISRTEGHRIQQTSSDDARHTAKNKGADVVKQWDSTLDGKTRPSHRMVDGEIREPDEKFSNGLKFPGDPAGGAAEVVNCRCVALTRARWALDESELQTLKDRAEYYGLLKEKAQNFEDFKEKYLKAAELPIVKEPIFIPAKTIEEAENYAKRFVDDSYWAGTGISYKGVGIDAANAVNEALTKLYGAYDIGKLGGIIAPNGNTKLGQLIGNAKAAYSPIRKSLILNKKIFKNLKAVEKDIEEERRLVEDFLKNPSSYVFKTKRAEAVMKACVTSGRATVPETIEDIINHEFGHTFEVAISKMDNYDLIKTNMKKYSEKISGYATTETGEYIAESFASFRKGENLIDPELEKAFKLLGKKDEKSFAITPENTLKSIVNLGDTGIIISDKQFGKKTGSHAKDWGLDPGKTEDREKLTGIITDIIQNRDEVRVGEWRGQNGECTFWIKGEDVVVTNGDEFVTVLKGGVNNARVKDARK